MSQLKIQLVPTEPIYTDKGSGAHLNVAIYQPIIPEGWYFLGHLAVSMPGTWKYTDSQVEARAPMAIVVQPPPNDPTAVSLVQPHLNDGAQQPLWTDEGSGGDQNIELYSFSAVDTTATYASVGLFASIVTHYGEDPTTTDPLGTSGPPAWSRLVAIRNDLVTTGSVGTQIWNDKDSGAKGHGQWQDISLWATAGSGGLIPTATFLGAEGYPSDPSSTTPSAQLLPNTVTTG